MLGERIRVNEFESPKSPAATQIEDSMQNGLNTLFLLGFRTAVYGWYLCEDWLHVSYGESAWWVLTPHPHLHCCYCNPLYRLKTIRRKIYEVPKHPLVITNVRRSSKAQWNTVQQLQWNQLQKEPGQSINTRDLKSRHIFWETQNSEKRFRQIVHLACRYHIWNYQNACPLFKMPTSSIG